MKQKWCLLGFIMGGSLPLGLLLTVLMVVIQQTVFSVTFKPTPSAITTSLEQAMSSAGFAPLFLVMLVVSMVILGWSIAKRWVGSKSIYTLCSLPTSRTWLYLCWLISGILLIVLLAAGQFISIKLAHNQYEKIIIEYLFENPDAPEVPLMSNSLFYAFIRWDFLRPFLPYTFSEAMISLIFLVSPAALTVRLSLGIFSRKLPAALLASGLWLMMIMIVTSTIRTISFWDGCCLIGLAAVTAWTIISGIRLMERGDML